MHNPAENASFVGTPSERIERQLAAHRVPGFEPDVAEAPKPAHAARGA